MICHPSELRLSDVSCAVLWAEAADPGMLDHILQEYKITHVLALAAQAGVRYATKDPASYVASNVAGGGGLDFEQGRVG